MGAQSALAGQRLLSVPLTFPSQVFRTSGRLSAKPSTTLISRTVNFETSRRSRTRTALSNRGYIAARVSRCAREGPVRRAWGEMELLQALLRRRAAWAIAIAVSEPVCWLRVTAYAFGSRRFSPRMGNCFWPRRTTTASQLLSNLTPAICSSFPGLSRLCYHPLRSPPRLCRMR